MTQITSSVSFVISPDDAIKQKNGFRPETKVEVKKKKNEDDANAVHRMTISIHMPRNGGEKVNPKKKRKKGGERKKPPATNKQR